MKNFIFLALTLFTTASFADSRDDQTIRGRISKCTQAYTSGFADDHLFEGYCVGNVQFAQESMGELSQLAQGHLGEQAELIYAPYYNEPGCSLIFFPQHPIACQVRAARQVIRLATKQSGIIFESR